MSSAALQSRPLPRYSASSRKRPAPARVQEAELRPSLLLAKQAISEVEAELDAAGNHFERLTNAGRGEVRLYSAGECVAWSFAVTTEPPVIETAMHVFREELRRFAVELGGEVGE